MRAVVHRTPERLDVGRAKAGRRAGAGASSVPSTGSKGDRIYIVYSCVYGRGTVHLQFYILITEYEARGDISNRIKVFGRDLMLLTTVHWFVRRVQLSRVQL